MGRSFTQDFDTRERRFFNAALRRGVARSTVVKALALASLVSCAIGFLVLADSPNSFGAHLMLGIGGASIIALIIAVLHARQRHTRDAFLTIDRCGDCGHKLCATKHQPSPGISTKMCTECGTTWTDLHRRDSINMLYGCA